MIENDKIQQLYNNLLDFSSGSSYYQVDFHLHSPVLKEDWKILDNKKDSNVSVKNFIQICKNLGYQIIFVADHNQAIFDFWNQFNKLSDEIKEGIIVYPCAETKFSCGTHVQFVFNPKITPKKLKTFLDNLSIKETWNENLGKLIDDQNYYKEVLERVEFIIFPHARLEKGILNIHGGSPTIRNLFKKPPFRLLNLPKDPEPQKTDKYLDLFHPECENLDPKMFHFNQGYPSYLDFSKFGRIKITDSHSISELEKLTKECPLCEHSNLCHYGPNWVKLAEVSTQAFNQLFYDQDSRILFQKPLPSEYLQFLGIHISSGFFENQFFRFHSNLNVILGSRGSGKSLVFELIQFVLDIYPKWNKENSDIDNWVAIDYIRKLRANLPNNSYITLFFQEKSGTIWAIRRYIKQYPDVTKLDIISKKKNEKEIQKFILSEIESFQKLEGKFERYPDLPHNIVEVLNQSKITHLATFQMQELLKYYDNYIAGIDFDFNKIISKNERNYKAIKNIIGELKKYYGYLGKWISLNYQIQEKEEKIQELKGFQAKINILEHNKWVIFDSIFNKLKESVYEIFQARDKIEEKLDEIAKIDFFKQMDFSDIPEMTNVVYNEIKDFLSKFLKPMEKMVKNFTFSDKQVEIEEIEQRWKNLLRKHLEEYNKFSKPSQPSFEHQIEEIQKSIDILKNEVFRFSDSKDKVKENEDKLLAETKNRKEINGEIFRLRKHHQKNFNSNYSNKQERISIKITEPYLTQFNEFLSTLGKSLKTPSEIRNILPCDLFLLLSQHNEDIFDELKKNGIKVEKKQLKIYEKISELSINPNTNSIILQQYKQSFSENVVFDEIKQDYFDKFIVKNAIHDFPEKLLELPLIDYSQELKIYIERGKRRYLLDEGSMGEKISSVLSFLLQDQHRILMIDQPDTELDFKSIDVLVKSILQTKQKRQLIFITHNANIPVLGDAEQIIFLKKDLSSNEKEHGIIKKTGGFEKMIDLILQVEGGPDAIENRTKKYGWSLNKK